MKKFNQFVTESYLKSDAMGYNIGDYLYHVTPKHNLSKIKKIGFIPQNGTSINGKSFKNRLYFATSLISAYDLTVNFNSYKEYEDYIIFKVKSDFIQDGWHKDPLFIHGIYVEYPVSAKYIVDVINADDLFNKFDDEDIENLYV